MIVRSNDSSSAPAASGVDNPVHMFWAKGTPPEPQRKIVQTNLQRNPRAKIATDQPKTFQGMNKTGDIDVELSRLLNPERWAGTGLSPETLGKGIRDARSGGKNIIVCAADLYKLCKLHQDGGTVLDTDTCPEAPLPEILPRRGLMVATRTDGTLSGNHYMQSGPCDPVVAKVLERARERIDGTKTIADVAYDPAVDELPSDIKAPFKELRGYLDLAKAHGFDASDPTACREFELMPWPEHARQPWGQAAIGRVMTAQRKHDEAARHPDLPNLEGGESPGSPEPVRENCLLVNGAWDEVDPHIGRMDSETGALKAYLETSGPTLSEPKKAAAERLLAAKTEFKDAALSLLLWSKLGPRFASTLTFAGPNAVSRALYEECRKLGPVELTESGQFIVPKEHRIDMEAPVTPHPTSDSTWQLVE